MIIELATDPQVYKLLIDCDPGEPAEDWGRAGATPGEPPSWTIERAWLATPDHLHHGREVRDQGVIDSLEANHRQAIGRAVNRAICDLAQEV